MKGAYDKSEINHASGSWNATWYCVYCWGRCLYGERFDETDEDAVDKVLRVLGVVKQSAIRKAVVSAISMRMLNVRTNRRGDKIQRQSVTLPIPM